MKNSTEVLRSTHPNASPWDRFVTFLRWSLWSPISRVSTCVSSAFEAPVVGPVRDPLQDCPRALPGLNSDLVRNTWMRMQSGAADGDCRLRLGGPKTLDICTTPAEAGNAIRHFATWIDYLAADGLGIEIRRLDGWRTCAMVDGIAVPIRIRERLHRVQVGNGLTMMLERWLGGKIQRQLVPSGRLELQILRMGVPFVSFDVSDVHDATAMGTVALAIRGVAFRELSYQRRMHAVALAEVERRSLRGAAKRTVATGQRPSNRQSSLPVVEEDPRASGIRELADVLEQLVVRARRDDYAKGTDLGLMSESVAVLARAVTSQQEDAAENRNLSVLTPEGKELGRSRTGRRSRRVA